MLSRQQGRELSLQEKQRYQPYFSSALLDKVRLVEEGAVTGKHQHTVPFWLHRNMQGIVLGYTIYLRKGAYQSNTASGIELLAHELVHVAQFASGMTLLNYLWASRKGYRQNLYEVEAYIEATKIRRGIFADT